MLENPAACPGPDGVEMRSPGPGDCGEVEDQPANGQSCADTSEDILSRFSQCVADLHEPFRRDAACSLLPCADRRFRDLERQPGLQRTTSPAEAVPRQPKFRAQGS